MKTGFAFVCMLLAGGAIGLATLPSGAERSVAPAEATLAMSQSDSPGSANTAQWAEQVTLPRENDGHYYTAVNIDGFQTRMLIDTGASVIALTGDDAAALGLYWDDSELAPIARGASGPIMGVQVTLPRVAVGAFEAERVSAIIVPDGLHISLLGQSFLSTIDRVEIADDRMVLGN